MLLTDKQTAVKNKSSTSYKYVNIVIMVTLWNRADHYIFMLWFPLSFFLSFFFPRLISVVADWMFTIHMVWP